MGSKKKNKTKKKKKKKKTKKKYTWAPTNLTTIEDLNKELDNKVTKIETEMEHEGFVTNFKLAAITVPSLKAFKKSVGNEKYLSGIVLFCNNIPPVYDKLQDEVNKFKHIDKTLRNPDLSTPQKKRKGGASSSQGPGKETH